MNFKVRESDCIINCGGLLMKDLEYRIPNKFKLSTDTFAAYYDAVDSTFPNRD
jgi:hypothetical protein